MKKNGALSGRKITVKSFLNGPRVEIIYGTVWPCLKSDEQRNYYRCVLLKRRKEKAITKKRLKFLSRNYAGSLILNAKMFPRFSLHV